MRWMRYTSRKTTQTIIYTSNYLHEHIIYMSTLSIWAHYVHDHKWLHEHIMYLITNDYTSTLSTWAQMTTWAHYLHEHIIYLSKLTTWAYYLHEHNDYISTSTTWVEGLHRIPETPPPKKKQWESTGSSGHTSTVWLYLPITWRHHNYLRQFFTVLIWAITGRHRCHLFDNFTPFVF